MRLWNVNAPILYVKKGCPYCQAAIDYLDEHHVKYEALDVRSSDALMKQLQDVSGQTKTPTLALNGAVLPDFGVEELDEFLRKNAAD